MPSEEFLKEYSVAEEEVQIEPASVFGIGQFAGGIIAVSVLSLLLKIVFKRFISGSSLILASVFSAVAISTFLYAFGSADGEAPRFGNGFSQYGVGGVIVLLVMLWWERRKVSKNV